MRKGSGLPSGPEGEGNSKTRNGTILFLVVAVGIGALVRHIFKRTPLPYTVILMVVGLIIGLASRSSRLSFLQSYTLISNIDPHLMLLTFLPTLIFESAFVMDFHTFKKTIFQALLLAGPGLIVSTVLTAVMARYVFTYSWTWVTAVMFGAIMSATDPVSVVALLTDLGTSKQLSTVIEGESLLNDGVSIVVFNVFLDELNPAITRSGVDIFLYLLRVTLGGPVLGYIMARLTIWWLARVFNDAVVEITITLASTYFTYYVGDVLLEVSGVLAVVTLGIEINARRTNISPEVEVFLLKFWGMLSYLANTLIFVLVGVVISQRAFSGVSGNDWIFLVSLYFAINVIRLIVVILLSPLLAHAGYPLDWKGMLVITWGGLRGAVGLALALVVEQTPGIPRDTIGSKVLFHTAGIVILTLLVNATTLRFLLGTLGLSDITNARRLNMITAIRRINETKAKAMRILKSDRFLADAHWDVVDRKTVIENPFDSEDEEEELQIPGFVVSAADVETHCTDCNAKVPRVLNHKELAEVAEDARIRIIRAEKTSYWKQYEEGMLDREAVVVLNNIADTVMDKPHKFIEMKDFLPYWKIPGYLTFIHSVLGKLKSIKTVSPPPPKNWCVAFTHRLALSTYFDWVLLVVVLIDIVIIILQLTITNSLASLYYRYTNVVFVGVYTSEAILKFFGLHWYYFRDPFNIFDLILLLISWVDILLESILPVSEVQVVISLLGILRIIRVARILKLFKHIVPLGIQLVTWKINHHIRQAYGIGKSFVVGEEEVLQQFDRIVSVVHKNVAHKMKKKVDTARLDVIRSLGLMQKEYPGVALSVKTRQAIRAVLNHCRCTVEQLQEGGVLEEHDVEILTRSIEGKMKRLQRYPVSQSPPDPNSILYNHPWLSGLESNVLRPLQECAHLSERMQGDVLLQFGEPATGLFIIVSGLVKVVTFKQVDETFSLSSSGLLPANFIRRLPPSPPRLPSPPPPPTPPSPPSPPSPPEDKVHFQRPRSASDTTEFHHLDTRRSLVPPSGSHSSSSTLRLPRKSRSSSSTRYSANYNVVDSMDFYDVGNVLGEIGILEQAISQIDAVCETDVVVFFIEREKLEALMKEKPVLEERMWKILAVHIASTLLIQTAEYQDWPINKLLLMLYEAAQLLPEATGAACVDIKNDWKHVVIISGEVESVDTKDKLMAPCIVPSRVGRLLLKYGNPKVMVVSLSKSVGPSRDYEDQAYYRWSRHYKKSFKTFLVKIKLMLWAQFVSVKEALTKRLIRFIDYVVNVCTGRGQRNNRVGPRNSTCSSTSGYQLQDKVEERVQIDPPDDPSSPNMEYRAERRGTDPDVNTLQVPYRFTAEEAKLQSQLSLLREIRYASGGRTRMMMSDDEMREVTGQVRRPRSKSPSISGGSGSSESTKSTDEADMREEQSLPPSVNMTGESGVEETQIESADTGMKVVPVDGESHVNRSPLLDGRQDDDTEQQLQTDLRGRKANDDMKGGHQPPTSNRKQSGSVEHVHGKRGSGSMEWPPLSGRRGSGNIKKTDWPPLRGRRDSGSIEELDWPSLSGRRRRSGSIEETLTGRSGSTEWPPLRDWSGSGNLSEASRGSNETAKGAKNSKWPAIQGVSRSSRRDSKDTALKEGKPKDESNSRRSSDGEAKMVAKELTVSSPSRRRRSQEKRSREKSQSRSGKKTHSMIKADTEHSDTQVDVVVEVTRTVTNGASRPPSAEHKSEGVEVRAQRISKKVAGGGNKVSDGDRVLLPYLGPAERNVIVLPKISLSSPDHDSDQGTHGHTCSESD